jgi:hypothetical protein
LPIATADTIYDFSIAFSIRAWDNVQIRDIFRSIYGFFGLILGFYIKFHMSSLYV